MRRIYLLIYLFLSCYSRVCATNAQHQYSALYDSLAVIETVYLHTDRYYYTPGDDIWFKAYLVESMNKQLTNFSKNLHVELISPDSKIVTSCVVKMIGGLGSGDFRLSKEIKSGKYKLRAYTNFMRNYGDQLFFNKDVIIVNSNDTTSIFTNNNDYVSDRINIQFFPEGGSLIDNVSSTVAFKATDCYGKGCNVFGEVYSSSGEKIATFTSEHQGMGLFSMRPIPGFNYYCIVKSTDGTKERVEIPQRAPKGVTLSAITDSTAKLRVTVRTNQQTLPLLQNRDFLLRISARKNLLKTVKFRIKSLSNTFNLPVSDLPTGIVMLTLSTNESFPLSERLIFIQKNGTAMVKIKTDKQIYNPRDSVQVKISLCDSTSARSAFLSLSAVEDGFMQHTSRFPSTISSWFLLESDVRGSVEDPSYYFDPTNPDRREHLDMLLLTQGWRDFQWKYENKNHFTAENGFSISGKVEKSFSKKNLDKLSVNVGIFKDSSNFITSVKADSLGRFSLEGLDFTGKARLIATAVGKDYIRGRIFLDPMKYEPSPVSESLFSEKVEREENLTQVEQRYVLKDVIRKKYSLADTIEIGEIAIIAKKKDPQVEKIESSRLLYSNPDAELIVTPDMTNYSNVIELLQGKISGIRIDGNKIVIRGYGSILLDTNPLVLIDGYYGTYDDLFVMPVSIIDRIDVLKTGASTSILGMRGSNGVISIITKAANFQPNDNSGREHTVNVEINGYNESRIFYSPKHALLSENKYIPDQRITIFWDPNIKMEANKDVFLKYYNADHSSIIRLTVEGITNDGIPVTGKTEYRVN